MYFVFHFPSSIP